MKLVYAQVIEALQGFETDAHTNTNDMRAPVSRVEIDGGQCREPDVLYICDDPLHAGETIIEHGKASEHAKLHVAGASPADVANAIARYQSNIDELAGKMRDRYYGEGDLQGLCQALADFVGNPVLAYDDTLLPIAQTEFPREFAIEFFGSETMGRDYVFKTIPDWSREAEQDPFAIAGAHRTISSDGSTSTVVCNVLSNGEFQGFMEIFEVNRTATAGEAVLLELACKILSSAHPFTDNRFVVSHLEGRPVNTSLAANWLATLHWLPNDGVYVLAIELPGAYVDDKLNMDHVMRTMRSFFPGSVSAQMGGEPVIVANDRLTPRDRTLADVGPFLISAGATTYIGASEVMRGISRLHEGYAHAQFAANFARRSNGGPIVRFEDCRFAFFADICNLEENLKLVLDPNVAAMFAEDEARGSQNALTAKLYIETGFNLNATAEALSVHRNTVAYRLRHIANHYGIDLSSPVEDKELIFQTLLSCRLLLEPA